MINVRNYLKWGLICLLCSGCCGPGPKSIHRAAWAGNKAEIAKLVSLGANIDAKFSPESCKRRITLLEAFAGRENAGMVEFLLSQGADPRGGAKGYGTALHIAARHGQTNVIDVLLAHGVNVDIGNGRGSTPLMFAAWNAQPEAVNFLIRRGANIKAGDRQNCTVLSFGRYLVRPATERSYPLDEHRVRYEKCKETVKTLLHHGAEVNVTNTWARRTPLMEAIAFGYDIELIEILLNDGANPAVTNKHGESPLWLANWAKSESIRQLIQERMNRR